MVFWFLTVIQRGNQKPGPATILFLCAFVDTICGSARASRCPSKRPLRFGSVWVETLSPQVQFTIQPAYFTISVGLGFEENPRKENRQHSVNKYKHSKATMGKPNHTSDSPQQAAASKMATNWTKWPSFAVLARKRKFIKICKTIEEGECEAVKRWLNATNATTMTPPPDGTKNTTQQPSPPALHWLLEFQPPLATVERVITALGDSVAPEDSVDAAGRTPLHVACMHRCASAVVARLTHGNGHYVTAYRSVDDDRLQTPLHCAILAHWPTTNRSASGSSAPPLRCKAPLDAAALDALESISTLVNAYPAAAHLRDRDGKTPLDYARERGADDSLVQLLQEQCGNKKENHHNRHQNHHHHYPSKKSHRAALSGNAILFKNPAHHYHQNDDDDHDHHHNPTESTEEITEVTSISGGYVSKDCCLIDDDDLSSLGSRSYHQSAMVKRQQHASSAVGRGPPKFERMIYEI